jgi:integrase
MNISPVLLNGKTPPSVELWKLKYPEAFWELERITAAAALASPKGYSLTKRPNKKHGFLYYVRYYKDGKEVPTKWNTHTNNLEEAELFATANRARLLSEYFTKHTPTGELYAVLKDYYTPDSEYLAVDRSRNRIIREKTRSIYYRFITKVFIPFLKLEKVKTFGDIDPPLIVRFQNHLLAKGNRPQTVNRFFSGINAVFNQLLMTGVIHESAFDKVRMLKAGAKNATVRGCHELEKIAGVFNTRWDDTLKYLLCLVIYTTGLRNSEIEKMKVSDIIEIDGCRFVNVSKSKTDSGIRMAPLHNFVYDRITEYCKETGKKDNDYIFTAHGGPAQSTLYNAANIMLAEKTGVGVNYIEEQHITFYSGRHFWKTLMSAEGLGEDIEEYFMGHKASGEVAKRYNHKDRRGRRRLLEKARDVFAILDEKVFCVNRAYSLFSDIAAP